MRFDTLKGVFGWPRPFDVGGNLLRNAGAVHVQSVRVEGQRWPARRVNEPVDTALLTRRFCPTVLDVRLSLSGISIDIRYITVYNKLITAPLQQIRYVHVPCIRRNVLVRVRVQHRYLTGTDRSLRLLHEKRWRNQEGGKFIFGDPMIKTDLALDPPPPET